MRCDLAFERDGDRFRLRARAGSTETSAAWAPPFDARTLEDTLRRLGRARRGLRHGAVSDTDLARQFGSTLYRAIAGSEPGALLHDALRHAPQVRTCIASTEGWLAATPWEYLLDEEGRGALCTSVDTPLVRFVPSSADARPAPAPETIDALNVLVVTSSPRDRERVHAGDEWDIVRDGARDLVRRGAAFFDRLDHPTPHALLEKVRERPWHVIHFVGHGAYDELREEGILWFEDEAGLSTPMSARYLATLLRDERASVRLVVLNACEGARTSLGDASRSVAESLVRAGLPLVAAMQFEIAEDAALTFARGFYSSLADRGAADAALADARKLLSDDRYGAQWGAPALFAGQDDARVFDERRSEAPVLAYAVVTADAAGAPGQGVYSLRRTRVTLGRQVRPPDLALENPHVGALHAEVILRDDGVTVRDLHSTNGTFVGEETARLAGERVLPFGESIRIRPYRIRFEPPDRPPAGGKTIPLD